MNLWDAVQSYIVANYVQVTTGLIGICLLQLALICWLGIRLQRLLSLMRRLTGGAVNGTLEDVLVSLLRRMDGLQDDLTSLHKRLEQLADQQLGCIQHVGIVRFNAFDDTGGQQSFSLALLDARSNGAVITSLFGRQESRCFAKPIVNGRCPLRLTEEEQQAIARAMEGMVKVEGGD